MTRWLSGFGFLVLITEQRNSDHGFETRPGEIFHLFFFKSYLLEMKLAAFLCEIKAEMSSKEWFEFHHEL